MKNKAIVKSICLIFGVVAILFAAVQVNAAPITRFRDSFSRPASTDLNASDDGKSGDLAPMDWVEQGNDGAYITSNNTLETEAASTDGNDGGVFWLDHNFLVYAEGGETKSFTVTARLLNGSSAGESRAVGFSVGQSRDEVLARTAHPNTSGDLFIGYDTIGSDTGTMVYEHGSDTGFINGSSGYAVTLAATFTFDDMNAGSALNYEVFRNDISIGTGSTTWSGTDENYISFSSNYSGYSRFSYVQIDSTIPEPATIGLFAIAFAGMFGLRRSIMRKRDK